MTDSYAKQAPPEADADLLARLMRFYGVMTTMELVRAQDHHIRKLQAEAFSRQADLSVRCSPREG